MWPHLYFVSDSTPSRPQLCIHLSSFLLRVINFNAIVKKKCTCASKVSLTSLDRVSFPIITLIKGGLNQFRYPLVYIKVIRCTALGG